MKEAWGKIIKCKQETCKGCFYADNANVSCEHAYKRTRPTLFTHVIMENEHGLKMNPKKTDNQTTKGI